MAFRNPINREVVRLAVPSILANITVPLVGIVDTAIAGHLGDAVLIGGIAVGTMLFDLLYWNMGFLRVGTGGITAQAYGRGDMKASIGTFSQGIATALVASMMVLAIQWLFAEGMFLLVDCSPEVERIARSYFFIRVWAAPATLSLFVFKGWFIGMQNTVFPMIVDLWVNIVNMLASWLLSFYMPLGISGVAVGTMVAQWTGLVLAFLLMRSKYRPLMKQTTIFHSMKWKYFRGFFSVNSFLFIRSLLMLVVYEGFTIFAARFGDVELAVSSVMMHLLLLYSYFVDGFAYAGEALTGRFIGEQDRSSLNETVKYTFFWGGVIGLVSTVAYAIFPRAIIGILTDNPEVIAASEPYLFWLLLMPLLSCVAFIWDGIYVGATASRSLMICMIWSAGLFIASFYLCAPHYGPQALYIAYFVHLVVRSVYMTLAARRSVWSLVPERGK
ncbi:MAG: MATE family efflux transporter [Bacteroidales bacterium]|nr:MATE family efflux transporter [Bacteroidales bacterium]